MITPYLVGENQANLQSKVFFVWGSTCVLCLIYAYTMIWETKGLTLEQVDRMMEEVGSPRRSAGWRPQTTFAHDMGMDASGKMPVTHHAHHAGGAEKAATRSGHSETASAGTAV